MIALGHVDCPVERSPIFRSLVPVSDIFFVGCLSSYSVERLGSAFVSPLRAHDKQDPLVGRSRDCRQSDQSMLPVGGVPSAALFPLITAFNARHRFGRPFLGERYE